MIPVALARNEDARSSPPANPRVFVIDPLRDPRWDGFTLEHPQASVFHSTAWLESIHRTFGHPALAVTTSAPGEPLADAIVFFQVESWLTGRRLVSLPFSDHCEPLTRGPQNLATLLGALTERLESERLAFFEIRPLQPIPSLDGGQDRVSTQPYCMHRVDLRPDLDAVFRQFHKSSTQRVVRKAERDGLRYEEGQSEFLLDHFSSLMLSMRRRHGALPHPRKWFQNLLEAFGPAAKIRLALHGEVPIAAILTLRFKDTLVYKYGGSDPRYHRLGGMHLLYWRSIQEAKQQDLKFFDLGRSDVHDEGLITFKDRWGAERSRLTYYTLAHGEKKRERPSGGWKQQLAARVLPRLPGGLLYSLSERLSRHIG